MSYEVALLEVDDEVNERYWMKVIFFFKKKKMNKIFFVFLVLLPVAAPHAGAIGVSDWVQPGSATLATLRARLQQALLPAAPQALAAEVAHCLGSLNSSGLFTDIDYSDTGTSWWKTAVHLKVEQGGFFF